MATDFSTRSHRALRRAGLLARECDAELTLVHVVEDDQPRSLVELERREASKFLDEQIHSLAELKRCPMQLFARSGTAFDGILQTAKISSADLIVMGSHRRQLLRDVFVGTTIERVIRIGTYPVLMVNNAVDHPYEKVLVATDMSEVSAWAIRIARPWEWPTQRKSRPCPCILGPDDRQDDPCGCERDSTNAYVTKNAFGQTQTSPPSSKQTDLALRNGLVTWSSVPHLR